MSRQRLEHIRHGLGVKGQWFSSLRMALCQAPPPVTNLNRSSAINTCPGTSAARRQANWSKGAVAVWFIITPGRGGRSISARNHRRYQLNLLILVEVQALLPQ
jgi:hypothetical protein